MANQNGGGAPAPLKLPPEEEVLDYLLSFDYFDQVGRPEEGRIYATHHLRRFIETVKVIPQLDKDARVLELGASPYFMTFLIKRYLGYEDVTAANYFGDYGERPSPPYATSVVSSERFDEKHTFDFQMFNLEMERFPYEDDSYDLVICCEILEHLASHPAHLMREVHRVLKPGGYFIVSTPNAVRLEKVWDMFRGENPYDPYSGDGVYARHNREYTAGEVADLMRVNNFEPQVNIADAYPHGGFYRFCATLFPKRKDNLFVVGRAHGATVQETPDWLYTNPEAHFFVTQNKIEVGSRDYLQLAEGWHKYEHWPPGVRWTGPEAKAWLLPAGGENYLRFRAHGSPKGSKGEIYINGKSIGRGDLPPSKPDTIQLPLPDDIRAMIGRGERPPLEVCFKIENPFCPARDLEGADDPREMGIAVETIELV